MTIDFDPGVYAGRANLSVTSWRENADDPEVSAEIMQAKFCGWRRCERSPFIRVPS